MTSVRRISSRILQSKMTSQQKKEDISKTFGVIADIQYADVEDATDFSGKQKRYYRNSLEIVKQAANHWRGNDVEFVVQLGDIIDSKAKQHKGSEIECSKVLKELNKAGGKYLVNIIGNHELYNFKREELKTLLNVEKDGITWHSFKPWENVPIRIIVLDGYEISSIEGLDQEKTDEANRYLGEHNPNDFKTFGVNWSDGLDGTNKRFMPYNGMLGMQQMNWLKETLTQCSKDGEYAIIFTHIPLHPSAADNLCLLWNYQEVLDIVNQSGRVLAVLAGHDHEGGYFCEKGTHHITLSSPLLCKGTEVAYMTVKIVDNEILQILWNGNHDKIPNNLEIKL